MTPLRLLILGLLGYLLYRLLTGGKKKSPGRQAKQGAQPRPTGELPTQDILVEDPVCHTYIPKKQAVLLQQQDATQHFCSTKCRDIYLSNKGAKS